MWWRNLAQHKITTSPHVQNTRSTFQCISVVFEHKTPPIRMGVPQHLKRATHIES